MSYTSVSCIVTSPVQADHILVRLKAAKFPSRDISVLLADNGFAHWSHRVEISNWDGNGDDGWNWVAGIGALPIPEVGPFMAAGPLLAASFATVTGAAAYGIAGGLIGLGISRSQTQRLEGRIRDGNILICVHTPTPKQVAQAKGIFAYAGAQDICCTEAAAPSRADRPRARASRESRAVAGPAQ